MKGLLFDSFFSLRQTDLLLYNSVATKNNFFLI